MNTVKVFPCQFYSQTKLTGLTQNLISYRQMSIKTGSGLSLDGAIEVPIEESYVGGIL